MGELAEYLVAHDANFRKARLPALYADFESQRSLNPDGYQANIRVWRQAITRAAWEGRLGASTAAHNAIIISLDRHLLTSLENPQYGLPLSIDSVVRESISSGDLVPLSAFLSSRESIFHQGWGEFPWGIIGWAARQLGLGASHNALGTPASGQFVAVENAEAAAKATLDSLPISQTWVDRVFTRNQFEKTLASVSGLSRGLSSTDVDVLLKYMSRDKGLIAFDGKTVKFKAPGESGVVITKDDATVASIKELIEDLRAQTTQYQHRVEELISSAKLAVSKGNTVAARAALKSKKLAETTLETRFAMLDQLEQTAAKIQQASDQAQLVKLLDDSANVLKGLNKQIGGAEGVDEVMDKLREQMHEVDEVGNIITEPGRSDIDEAEIDYELEALAAVEEEKTNYAKEVAEEVELERRLAGIKPTPHAVPEKETPVTGVATGVRRMSLEDTARSGAQPAQ